MSNLTGSMTNPTPQEPIYEEIDNSEYALVNRLQYPTFLVNNTLSRSLTHNYDQLILKKPKKRRIILIVICLVSAVVILLVIGIVCGALAGSRDSFLKNHQNYTLTVFIFKY